LSIEYMPNAAKNTDSRIMEIVKNINGNFL
jgi:hypothetical protein